MIVKEHDFELELNEGCIKFDLSILYVVNAKKEDKKREEMKLVGYGMTLETCLHYIINYRLSQKKDVYSLKEYLDEFKNEMKKLSDIANMKWEHLTEKTESLSE